MRLDEVSVATGACCAMSLRDTLVDLETIRNTLAKKLLTWLIPS
jgi:hypothetical protein